VYTELHLVDGRTAIYDKSLKQLGPLLPTHFHRIHKSYVVDAETIETIQTLGGGQYRVVLASGDCLPVSSQKIKELRQILDL
jgi:two-component system response regulator LytT